MVQKTLTMEQAKVEQKGNLGEGQTLLFSSGDMHESSRNGATDHQN
jgi:hypothetical protein